MLYTYGQEEKCKENSESCSQYLKEFFENCIHYCILSSWDSWFVGMLYGREIAYNLVTCAMVLDPLHDSLETHCMVGIFATCGR